MVDNKSEQIDGFLCFRPETLFAVSEFSLAE